MSNLVEIENLRVSFRQDDGSYNDAVRGVSLSLGREKLGIVGESGSGKSLTGRSLLGVLPPYAKVSVDRMEFDGIDLTKASGRQRRALRGGRMGMILQDPKFSLNPVMKMNQQIVKAIHIGDRRVSAAEAHKRATTKQETNQIREPERVLGLY